MAIRTRLRPIIQVLILVGIFAGGAAGKGADYARRAAIDDEGTGIQSRARRNGDRLEITHLLVFSRKPSTYSPRDLAFLRDKVAGAMVIGVLAPTVATTSQPAAIVPDTARIAVALGDDRGDAHDVNVEIPLTEATDVDLDRLLPPEPGGHWQAFAPENAAFLDLIPVETTTYVGGHVGLTYDLDLRGDGLCDGCVVELAICARGESPLPKGGLATAPLRWLTGVEVAHGQDLTCLEPASVVVQAGGEEE